MTDPRGPMRQIENVERTPSTVLLTLSCGHVAHCATHFTYKPGRDLHCYECGQQAKQAQYNADIVDGYNRDDLGESPDY